MKQPLLSAPHYTVPLIVSLEGAKTGSFVSSPVAAGRGYVVDSKGKALK